MNSFYQHLIRLFLFIIFVIVTLQSPVLKASEKTERTNTESIALSDFQHAIKDANARLIKYREDKQALSMIKTSEDREGNILQQQFIPQKIEHGKVEGIWQTLREDAEFNQSVNVADNIIFESRNFDIERVQLITETNSTWVFSIPNIINVDNDGEDEISNQDMMEIDDAISENLLTEIIISKENAQIKGLKIYANAPFKPSFMVTIEKFELRLGFEEAWPNGPIIRKNMSKHITGAFGWLVSIDELVTTELSKIQKITLI